MLRLPSLAGSVIFTAFLAFAAAPAHAACTVGGGAAIDGFAVGASVACPTGTVQAGTVPPDGATITNKNVAGGSTTFSYTTPAVGTVQLAGTVNLTAAAASSSSDTTASDTTDAVSFITNLLNEDGGGVSDFITSPPVTTTALDQQIDQAKNTEGEIYREDLELRGQEDTLRRSKSDAEWDLRETKDKLDNLRNERDGTAPLPEDPEAREAYFEDIEQRVSDLKNKVAELEAQATEAAIAIDEIEDKRRELSRKSFEAERRTLKLEKARDALRSTGNSQFRRSGNFSANFSLSQFMRSFSSTRLGANETDNPVVRRPPDLPDNMDAFARITYSSAKNDNNDAGFESKSWQGALGIDYRIRPRVALGMLTAFTSNTSETSSISSSSDSLSYLAGPFARFNPTDNITVSGSFSIGETSTDLKVNSATSSFKSFQTLSTLGLKGSWSEGNWTVAPSANLFYSTSRTEAFTDSAGNESSEKTSRNGTFNFGPQVSYLHLVEDSPIVETITPSLRVSGTYKFTGHSDTRFANGTTLTSDRISAGATLGTSLQFINGMSADLSYSRTGFGGDLKGWSVTAGASAPLGLLLPSLGRDATTSFQFTAEPQAGPTFMARIVIPVF